MEGYYDYQPTRSLQRPLVLVSFVNELTRAVANSLASTTGLPLRLLDDVVEHRLGTSSVELVQLVEHLSGPTLADWRRMEQEALTKAVHSRPQAVVAVGEGALAHADSLELVLAQTQLIYLYLSFDEAQKLALAQPANRKATLLAELPTDELSLENNLMELFTSRRVAYERAHHSVDVRGESAMSAGKRVLELIG